MLPKFRPTNQWARAATATFFYLTTRELPRHLNRCASREHMSISTKNRRKLIFGEREFVWYVKEDSDSADMVLHVASQDKKFIVLYHLRQPSETRYLTILGKQFSGLSDAGGVWIRVLCPEFETDSVVTPRNVRDLIEWCLSEKSELVRVDWLGRPLEPKIEPTPVGV